MNFQVVIEPRALNEIQNAINYYDSKLIGLGHRFYLAIDEHVKAISFNPYYEFRYKDYRALPVKKFPYLIIFFIDEKTSTVYISAVFQTKQNVKKLPK